MPKFTPQQNLQIAIQHHQAGRLQQAELLYRQVLTQLPNEPEALHLLGVLAYHGGHHNEAVDLICRAIAANPQAAVYYCNLGLPLAAQGQLPQAIASYRKALAIAPDLVEAHYNLGKALQDQGNLADAIASYQAAASLKPGMIDAHNNMGNALRDSGHCDEAVVCFRKALALAPNYAEAHYNLGNALRDQGQLDAALAAYDMALALRPDFPLAHSNKIYALQFHAGSTGQTIHAELLRYRQRHAKPLAQFIRPHQNNRDPTRPLRIGYVSPDFYAQAEAFFVVPLLEAHHRDQFEIHCYASVIKPDAITERLQRAAAVWHDVHQSSDEALAEQIRHDGIDILVDLTMHMAHHRLPVFARKPAPVQVTWLAYPGSTGLETIDYRITDSHLDPPEMDTSIYTEQSIRLPDSWCCYDPLCDIPPTTKKVSDTFSANNPRPIVFGSLNNPCKINEPILQLWSQVIRGVPNSRLLLHVISLEQRRRIENSLLRQGIGPERLEFIGRTPRLEYLRLYDRIDIALDPLPYNGITTTCDALWMGVPVITLAGQTAPGRAGLGLLSTLGLPELATTTEQDFIQAAVNLAHDPSRLAHLRSTLRQRMQSSPLMNAQRFAQNLESAYRQMWQTWCATRS